MDEYLQRSESEIASGAKLLYKTIKPVSIVAVEMHAIQEKEKRNVSNSSGRSRCTLSLNAPADVPVAAAVAGDPLVAACSHAFTAHCRVEAVNLSLNDRKRSESHPPRPLHVEESFVEHAFESSVREAIYSCSKS